MMYFHMRHQSDIFFKYTFVLGRLDIGQGGWTNRYTDLQAHMRDADSKTCHFTMVDTWEILIPMKYHN